LGVLALLGAVWMVLVRSRARDRARQSSLSTPDPPTPEPAVVESRVLVAAGDSRRPHEQVSVVPRSIGTGAVAVPRGIAVRSTEPARLRQRVLDLSRTLDLRWGLTVLTVAGLALALRLINHSTNYDVFVDEITYSRIGQAVALGHGVTLYGGPFFLHPPLFFYLEAGVLDLFGGASDAPVKLVLALRPINCVLGAVECALVMALISALGNRTAAVLAGVFEACDPFVQLWDGRVLLETLAMTFAVLGWLALAWLARQEDAHPDAARRSSPRERAAIFLGGLCFGASLLTKETYAFVGVAPLAAMLALGSPVRRRVSGAMLIVALGCLLAYLATVVANGHLSAWYSQQVSGLTRAIGTKQISGFNQKGHAGFSSRAGAELSLYLVTYLVIFLIGLATATGIVAWLRAAREGRTLIRERRLAILLGAGGVGYVGYAVLFGGFETQIFYMCVIGGLPVLATQATVTLHALSALRWRRGLLIAGAVMSSVALIYELAINERIRSETDSDIPALVSYVSHHVPALSLVDSTDGVTQFVLQGVRIDGPRTVPGLERDKPGYIVVDPGLVLQGYVTLGRGFQSWLDAHAHLVFAARGRTIGRLLLYRTVYAARAR
jgi:hypothetical protein